MSGYAASQEQVSSLGRYVELLAEKHLKMLALMPKCAGKPGKSREYKHGMSERTRLLQRSPEARAKRDIEIIAAWKAAGPERSIREVSRLVVCSPTTVRTILIAAGLATDRTRAPAAPPPEGSALYKSIVREISAKKTVSTK